MGVIEVAEYGPGNQNPAELVLQKELCIHLCYALTPCIHTAV
jgi:hypothetical protein